MRLDRRLPYAQVDMTSTQTGSWRVPAMLPPLLFLPVVAYLLVHAVTALNLSLAIIIGLWGGGFVIWTLTEYLIHRFVFHHNPGSQMGRRFLYLFHGFHHEFPADLGHIVVSPLASIPLAVLFYLVFALAVGNSHAAPLFAGFAFGYVCYDSLHYAIHHRSLSRFRLLNRLKRRHYRHHFGDESCEYGVTSPLWDFIFRTLRA
ncbi:MAG TPA: hypothetical protein DIC52_19920, partial [Candidatus Latescibacteria bacterium]|nr:hypothetical protein [Candidatus Latescibacterota bacterium]